MLCSQNLPKILKKEDHPGGLSGRWTGGRRAQTRQMMDREAFATFWSRGQELRKGLPSPQDLSLLFKRFIMQQNFDPVCVLRIIPHYYRDTRWGWEKEVSILNLDSNFLGEKRLIHVDYFNFCSSIFFFLLTLKRFDLFHTKRGHSGPETRYFCAVSPFVLQPEAGAVNGLPGSVPPQGSGCCPGS